MADSLDSIVKGAPLPSLERDLPKDISGTSGVKPPKTDSKVGDPLSHAPSTPSMIYLNLLVLEASLRAQYLELRARRRHHTFFLSLLSLWIFGFGYALLLAPREDGSGERGGSVYWVVESAERVCLLGGVITALLVWAAGIWERGVRWPRRWFAVSNRGLRVFNCKLVVMKRPWWKEMLSTLAWFLTYGLFTSSGSAYQYVEPLTLREVDKQLGLSTSNHPMLPIVAEDAERGGQEQDLAPGGDYVKVLLMAKPFSPTFRENWEIYRADYWEKENERRALLRARLQERERALRKQQGGWLCWLSWRKARLGKHHIYRSEPEKSPHHRHLSASGEHKRTRSSSMRRASVSTTPSRSPTPTCETDEATVGQTGSIAPTASVKGRKKLSTMRGSRPRGDSRSVTPENPSPLARESSLCGATPPGSGNPA